MGKPLAGMGAKDTQSFLPSGDTNRAIWSDRRDYFAQLEVESQRHLGRALCAGCALDVTIAGQCYTAR